MALGNVERYHQDTRSVSHVEFLQREFHVYRAAALRLVSVYPERIYARFQGSDQIDDPPQVLRQLKVVERHAQELVTRVAIASHSGVVDHQVAARFVIVQELRQGRLVEENAVTLF